MFYIYIYVYSRLKKFVQSRGSISRRNSNNRFVQRSIRKSEKRREETGRECFLCSNITRVYTRAVIYSEAIARHNVSPVVWLYTFRMYRGGLLLEKNKKVDRKWSGWNNRVQGIRAEFALEDNKRRKRSFNEETCGAGFFYEEVTFNNYQAWWAN